MPKVTTKKKPVKAAPKKFTKRVEKKPLRKNPSPKAPSLPVEETAEEKKADPEFLSPAEAVLYRGWYFVWLTKSPRNPEPEDKPLLRYLEAGQSYLCDPKDLGRGLDKIHIARSTVSQYVKFIPVTVPE